MKFGARVKSTSRRQKGYAVTLKVVYLFIKTWAEIQALLVLANIATEANKTDSTRWRYGQNFISLSVEK